MKLDELRIIVSGGAQGLGRHFALRLAESGARVAVGDVNEDGLAETVAAAKGTPWGVVGRRLDVSNEADVASFVDWAHAEMGGLNAVVNNAAILRDGLLVRKVPESGDIQKMSRAQWDDVLAVNLVGAALLARDVVVKMVETNTRPGVIVNISSLAREGVRGRSNYGSAKAALATSTVTWAKELAPFGIRVGAVAPGMIETPMTERLTPKAREALVNAIPLGRFGLPDEVWLAVRFILECDYFDGRTIDVDGGVRPR